MRVLASRALERPVNLEIISPSSTGKTFVPRTCYFLEDDSAFYELTAMSERALIYTPESLSHRIIFFPEPDGLPRNGAGYAAIKTLSWEGRLKYETVMGHTTVIIEKPGPTGFIVVSTRPLDEQLTNRAFQIGLDTSEEQTRRIMEATALASEGIRHEVDVSAWQAYSRLVGEPVDVEVPYGTWLARNMSLPPNHLMMRSEFTQFLNLIKASAVQHRFQRRQTETGLLIASLSDYAIVHRVASHLIGAARIENLIEQERLILQTVEGLYSKANEPVSQAALRKYLELPKATLSMAVKRLMDRGYLVNLESRKGVDAQLVPRKSFSLPSPCRLAQFLLEDGQGEIVQEWFDPFTGQRHNCREH